MRDFVQDELRKMLADEEVVGVLGLRDEDGLASPYVFTSVEETPRLVSGPKWPLAKAAWRFARSLPRGKSIGLVCRGCDIRAIEELLKAGQLDPGAVRTIGFACTDEQASACMCETPFPPGDTTRSGVDPLSLPAVRRLSIDPGRLDLWREHFRRCIKCYGCRNSCPICVCPTCKLEEDAYVTHSMVPPDPLAYHLIRAMHLADRCVGCGACQDSCPSGLPLLALHLAVRGALRQRTGYAGGTAALSPLLAACGEAGLAGTAAPQWEDTLKDE